MMNEEEFLEAVDSKARLLVAGDAAYEIGIELWRLGMATATDEALRDVAWPLWLIWGHLTDKVDGPGGEQTRRRAEAEIEMRRAAKEWLAAREGREPSTRYFDRWVYVECGFEHPGPDDA